MKKKLIAAIVKYQRDYDLTAAQIAKQVNNELDTFLEPTTKMYVSTRKITKIIDMYEGKYEDSTYTMHDFLQDTSIEELLNIVCSIKQIAIKIDVI
jgi:hypothetical protein